MRHLITTAAFSLTAAAAFAHGDVAPQPVDVGSLPPVGEEWVAENPYRAMGPEVWAEAVRVGASGFNQNCARCHGLEAISGGLAPDLRYLEAEAFGDEWFLERFRNGYTQDGVTKMPAFGELLGQEAAWAIRTYVETRPDDGAIEAYGEPLAEIRDTLADLLRRREAGEIGQAAVDAELAPITAKLSEIAGGIGTASGAPVADSAASRAASALKTDADLRLAFEVLTVEMSKAR